VELELERQLIERSKQGDMGAYEQLYRGHKDALVHRVIAPRLSSRADVEDVLVDTFTTALERLHQFRWTGRSLFSWLARIAANKCTDVYRQRARARKDVVISLGEVRTPAVLPDEQLARLADQAETHRKVEAVLSGLNERYARVLRLRLLEGTARRKCAEMLGVSVATFDVLLLRSVRSFRKAWEERESLEGVD